jgi:dGTP triphosphohydrolase
MRDLSNSDIFSRLQAIMGKLSHLRTPTELPWTRRRHNCENDLYALGNPFIRDRRAIWECPAWRRLPCKNQVASYSHLPNIRNRLSHVCEVMAESVRIADYLGLNIDLTEAIAAGHDIGHVPLGHQGEHYIASRIGKAFCHEVMGVIVLQHIERGGRGLNLTHSTLDGMHRHSGKRTSDTMTQEAWCVRYGDKIAYLFADFNDFKRMGWPCSSELHEQMEWFGQKQRDRTIRAILALCEESVEAGRVRFETSEAAIRFDKIRTLMYAEYVAVVEQNVARMLDPIWDSLQQSGKIPPWLGIALLTDTEVQRFTDQTALRCWRGIMDTSLAEVLAKVSREKLFSIDPFNLDLDW